MIKKEKIKKYLDDLASDASTPGGGSATSIVAATGVSLALMSINVSKKRKNFEIEHVKDLEHIKDAIARLEDMKEKMLIMADADVEVFENYMAAYKKGGDLVLATNRCFEVPYRLTLLCFDAISAINEIAKFVVSSVSSDLAMSFVLLKAAVQSCDINMAINNTDKLSNENKIKFQNIHKMIVDNLR